MTAVQDPYSRIYWRIVDDDRFADIYLDDAAFAAWTRLLLLADSSWPASAPLPFALKRKALDKLVGAGLVELVSGGRFRLHGLERERAKRSVHASNAAAKRWEPASIPRASGEHTPEHPVSSANGMPRLDKRRLDKRSTASGLSTDQLLMMRAKAVLADKMASDEQKQMATDALKDLGVTA